MYMNLLDIGRGRNMALKACAVEDEMSEDDLLIV